MTWKTVQLAEIAHLCLGKMLDANKNRGELRPYLGNINVRWGHFNLSDLKEMRFEQKETERYSLNAGDIVLCEGGEPGRCALWKGDIPDMMIQKALHRIRPHSGVDSKFLYYSLFWLGNSGGFEPFFTGSTIKHLPGEQLAKVQLGLPPLEDQIRIAAILSAYDDLIEINRRRIKLLEEMARGLFDEWFIRFRFPDHEGVAMINTPNGQLPENWRWETLASVCDGKAGIQTGPFGSQLHQHDYSQDGVPVVMPKNIANLRIDERDIKRIPERLARTLDQHLMNDGDIVYGRRGDIGRRAIIPSTHGLWFCGTGCLRFRPNRAKVSPRFLFEALGLPFTESAIRGRAQGATMPNLSAGVMKEVPVLYPPLRLQKVYASIADPIYEFTANLYTANESLAAARNLLLPRLMSGDLSLSAAEREMLEAA